MYLNCTYDFSKQFGLTDEETDRRNLSDGIYEVSETTEVLDIYRLPKDEKEQQIKDFMAKHPDYRIASAYETDRVILLSEEPKKLNLNDHLVGSGFNYGSTNIINNCPKRILILAEND